MPITQSNFEGTGVKPDVEVEREGALHTAHLLALETLLAKEENIAVKPALQWALDGIPRQAVALSENLKKSYIFAERKEANNHPTIKNAIKRR